MLKRLNSSLCGVDLAWVLIQQTNCKKIFVSNPSDLHMVSISTDTKELGVILLGVIMTS